MKNKIKIILCLMGIGFGGYYLTMPAKAQNSYGGLCCEKQFIDCPHPIGITFENARWVGGASTCTGYEDPIIT